MEGVHSEEVGAASEDELELKRMTIGNAIRQRKKRCEPVC